MHLLNNHVNLDCFYKSLSPFVTHVSWDSFSSTPHRKYNAAPGELQSKFTTLEKPYIWILLVYKSCATVQMFWSHNIELHKELCDNI